MALCVLTAGWKTNGISNGESGDFVDGLLAIVVDHGLRSESKDEANIVYNRVSQMGIQLCIDIILALSLYFSFGLMMCIEIRGKLWLI